MDSSAQTSVRDWAVLSDDTTDSYFWYQVDIKWVSIDKMTSDAYLIPYIQLNISFKYLISCEKEFCIALSTQSQIQNKDNVTLTMNVFT